MAVSINKDWISTENKMPDRNLKKNYIWTFGIVLDIGLPLPFAYKQEIARNLWFYGCALDLQQSPPS